MTSKKKIESARCLSPAELCSALVGCLLLGGCAGQPMLSDAQTISQQDDSRCTPAWYTQTTMGPMKSQVASGKYVGVGRGRNQQEAHADAMASIASQIGGKLTQQCIDEESRSRHGSDEQLADNQRCATQLHARLQFSDVFIQQRQACGDWVYVALSWNAERLLDKVKRQAFTLAEKSDPARESRNGSDSRRDGSTQWQQGIPFWQWRGGARADLAAPQADSIHWRDGHWFVRLLGAQYTVSQRDLWQSLNWNSCIGNERMSLTLGGEVVAQAQEMDTLTVDYYGIDRPRYLTFFNVLANGAVRTMLANHLLNQDLQQQLRLNLDAGQHHSEEAYVALFSEQPIRHRLTASNALNPGVGMRDWLEPEAQLSEFFELSTNKSLTSLCAVKLDVFSDRLGTY